jgi:hypothetical protein
MDTAKIAIFLLGGFFLLLAVLIEAGATALLGPASNVAGGELGRPGLGISYLALLDAVLVYTLATIASDFIAPLRAVLGRLQALVTFVLALVGLLATIVLLIIAFILLTLMVTLLLAVPFGTLAYLAAWGHFATGEARVLLSLLMSLKIAGVLAAVLSSPSLLKNKALVLLIGSSLGCTFLLGFLHALPPGILVSITDTVGALIAGVLAAIWMLVFLVGAIPGLVRAVRSTV